MMKKLKLDLDDLRVATFDPAPEPGDPRGTVAAHLAPTYPLCPRSLEPTCQLHCSFHCDA